MPIAHLNGVDLYHEIHGEGPDLVFVHGRSNTTLGWWQQLAHFSPRYRCIAYDQRGYGLTRDQVPGRGRTEFVSDLSALLDHVSSRRAHIVGQSLGGRAALGVALAQPERVASLTLAATTASTRSAAIVDSYRNRQPLGGSVLERVLSATFRDRHPDLTQLYGQIHSLSEALHPPNRTSVQQTLTQPDGPEEIEVRDLVVPTLVVVGDADAIVPPAIAARFAELIPGARLSTITDAGHAAFFERPQDFNGVLEDFLNAHAGRSAP